MNLATMSRQRLIALTTAIGVVLVLIWWFVLWSPRQHAYSQAQAALQSESAQVQQLQAQLSQLRSQQARSGQAALLGRLATEQAAIPAQPDLAQLILQINTAAQDAGVNFLAISPSEPTASTGAAPGASASASVYPITMTLSITGGYYQVLDFVNRLDALPRLLVISTFGVSPNGGQGAELSVSLTMKAFTTQPFGASPAGAGTASTTTTTAPGATTTTTAAGGATTTTAGTSAP